jgi:hypothetical protein
VSTQVVIIAVVVFLALDILFFYLIIKAMERPSASAALARVRGLSLIPDSEGPSIALRLREVLPLPRGDFYDIVSLSPPEGEAYLYTTLPPDESHLPKARENRRQFIAVVRRTTVDGRVFIHPSVRPVLGAYKRRRLFRVFKTGSFLPVPEDRQPEGISERFRVRVEHEGVDPGKFLTDGAARVLAAAPRPRGLAVLVCRDGLVVYISPLVKDKEEAGKFCDFALALADAIAQDAS